MTKIERLYWVLRKVFPFEQAKYLASGVKSSVFRTKSGKIIRIKPLTLKYGGTYAKEKRVLDFIIENGGLGLKIPKLKTFISFVGWKFYAFSVHDGIEGTDWKMNLFRNLSLARKKYAARQLVDALIKFHDMGRKSKKNLALAWILRRRQTAFFNYVKYYLRVSKYVKKKGMLGKFARMCRAARSNSELGLTHNDLHFSNIVVDKNFNLVGMIDFDSARMGHFEHNLRKLYDPLRKMMIDYCDKTGIKKINRDVLNYHRLVFLLRCIKKSKTDEEKSAYIAEINGMF